MTFADPPFLPPPDIIVDVPPPPSVNRGRKIDWKNYGIVKAWRKHADAVLMKSKQVRGVKKHRGRFELQMIVDEKATGCDLDNLTKCAADYLKRIELIEDDGPKYMRKVVLEYGHAPEGVRLVIKPIEGA
jgi:Holliday junction resolvase RusA-like endonuclease